MLELYKNYLIEELDEQNNPLHYALKTPDHFNFAYDIIDELGTKTPNRRAMLWCSSKNERKTFTFKQIKDGSDQAASYFLSLGIKKGDKVMLILKRHYQFWYAILGLCKIGAIAVPATNQLRKEDLEYRFEAAEIHTVISTLEEHEVVASEVEKAAKTYGKLKHMVGVNGKRDGWKSFDEGLLQAPAFTPLKKEEYPTRNDVMLLYFTSGTTAKPKMVAHDFYYPLGHIITAKYWQKVIPDGLHLTVSETGWAKSIWGKLYGQWIMEAGIYVYDFDRFNPVDILQHLQDDKITTFCAPPTIYRFMLKENLEAYDLSSITHATIAGEALNPIVYEQFYQKTGLKLSEGFGQTETLLTIFTDYGTEPKAGAMGKPSQWCEVVLLKDDDTKAATNELGEICLKITGDRPIGMFMGYYKDQKLTDTVWHDGYYHTGDLAICDEDGYYWFDGRTDDIIKSSGYRISANEVEGTLMECPYVLECAITGVPDEFRGQKIKATIVLTKECIPSEELKKEIQTFMKTHTSPYKYPRVIEFVDALPKTISGKIRRVAIREKSE